MTKPVRRAGVIGAGVMGSGIMAHLRTPGVDVVMLDIVPPGLSEDEEKKDPAKRNGFCRRRPQGRAQEQARRVSSIRSTRPA